MIIGSEYTHRGKTYTVSGYVTVGGKLMAVWLIGPGGEFRISRKELE